VIKSDGENTVETFPGFDTIVRFYRSRKDPGRLFPARQEKLAGKRVGNAEKDLIHLRFLRRDE
jgi:hypothetical protein